MYRYETHLHTAPVSKCAKGGVRETVEYYKNLGYDGIFITNHFLDGNINIDKTLPYEEQLAFYVSDYEEAVKVGQEIGIKVFFGVEMTYKGTDFLIYGLMPDWYFAHPEIMEMKKSEEMAFFAEQGALVVQAHPFAEARYIDHIRLYPRSVHGVEVLNAHQKPERNVIAKMYAEHYGLIPMAGSDNHSAGAEKKLAGVECEAPVMDEQDFVEKVKAGKMKIFSLMEE